MEAEQKQYLINNTEYNGEEAHDQVVDYMHKGHPTTPPTGEEALKIALDFILDGIWDSQSDVTHVITHIQPLPVDSSEIIEILKEILENLSTAKALIEQLREE